MPLSNKDIADYAVSEALKAGAEYAEARLQWNMEQNVSLKNGEFEPPGYSETYGLGVRVLYKGAMGFGATNILTRESVKELATALAKKVASSVSSFRTKVKMSDEDTHIAKWGVAERHKPEDVEVSTMVSSLKEIDSELMSKHSQDSLKFRVFGLGLSLEEKYYANSNATKVESRVPRVGMFGILTAVEAGSVVQRFVQAGETGGWEIFESGRMKKRVVEEGDMVVKIVRGAEKFTGGKMDVIVGPEVTGIMTHESVGHPQEADRVLGREGAQAGESYLTESDIGLQVGSQFATVIDDPTIPGTDGYYLYDDEGVPARKRVLIKEGRINEFLHNRETAEVFGVRSNAAARASYYNVEPIIRMSNTYVEPGDYTLEEMVKEVKEGVLIKNFMEWNIDDKRYNSRFVGHEAYRIEGGELKGLVRNPVLELTTPKLWGSVAAKTRDLVFDAATCGKGDPMQGIPVGHGGPYMLLKDVVLGGR
jgi:TldD protein